ncbi:MAG: AAA family ATPase [Candidatus Saccharimonas sp.]
MSELVCHPETITLIQQLADNLPHAVLLYGSKGVGLQYISREIAGKSLVNIVRPTDRDGNIMNDGSGEIRIPQIRELIMQTRGKSTTRRVVIVDDADKMNLPAQQAFLKLLEEPTDNTHFILTAHNTQALLPTIRSRVQTHVIKPISQQQSGELIYTHGVSDTRRIQQLLFLAEGRPAELTHLLIDEVYFTTQVAAVEDARTLLQGSLADRTRVAQKYQSDRIGALRMLEQAVRIVQVTLKRKPSITLITSVEQLTRTHQRIANNANVRLQLLNFVVQ